MSASETERTSYVRATREIIPSESLKELLTKADELCDDFATDPELAQARVFAAEGLWVVLLERRAKASNYANSLMRRLHSRLESPKITKYSRVSTTHSSTQRKRSEEMNPLHAALRDVQSLYVPKGQPQVVRASRIVTTKLENYPYLGTELSLYLDDGPVTNALLAQYDLFFDVSSKQYGSGRLPKMRYDPDRARMIPFMHLPLEAEAEESEFVELLSPCLPVYGMTLGSIEYTLRTVETDDPA